MSRRKFPGIYKGVVTENDDDLKQGRVKAVVECLGKSVVTTWALPCFPMPGLYDEGEVVVPPINAPLWIMFQGGDFDHPVYMGGWFPAPTKTGDHVQQTGNTMPEEAQEDPRRIRQIKTRSGHTVIYDDREGEEKIEIQDAAGQIFRMTCNMPEGKKRDSAGKQVKKNSDITDSDVDEAKIEIIDIFSNALEMTEDGIRVIDTNENEVLCNDDGMEITDTNDNKVVLDGDGIYIECKNGNKATLKNGNFTLEDSGGNKIDMTNTGMNCKDKNGNEIDMAAAGITLKTGDAVIWAPNIVPSCLFTGAPHGGSGGGIVKLKGG